MATDSKIEDFAEELGRLLGTAEAKAKGWLGQREQIAKTLAGIRDTANGLLSQLGEQATGVARALARGRRGRPPGSKNKTSPGRAKGTTKRGPGRPKGSGKKKRTMSAEARARISAAQKARWAKVKKERK
jgi:hypothetical protein